MSRYRQLSHRALVLAATLGTLACASGGAPATTAAPPPPRTTVAPQLQSSLSLQPSAAAERAAQHVQLTGRELGTMWTFENPPLDYWKQQYDFTPPQGWLDHVRLSSVRFGEICSASFVSPDGLVMTNHHCARECVAAQSTGTKDYVADGFYAARQEDEPTCPDLYLDQLVEIQDVTQQVQGAVPANASTAQQAQALEAQEKKIQDDCEAGSQLHCQVVSLFQGGQYQLYKYRRYSPVKLVFAPELQAGFFGGDPDNFTYPRYALDVSFVRAYQPDSVTPLHPANYFKWRTDGPQEGELVFITGNPGSTSRLITVAQLMYEKVYRHPFTIQLLEAQRDLLQRISQMAPQAARQVREQLFGIENSLKAYRGELSGLDDTLLVGRKILWEKEFRGKIQADPQLQATYGDLWDKIAAIQRQKLTVSPPLNIANRQFLGVPDILYAGTLVAYLRAMAQPEADRPDAFQGDNLKQVESMLNNASPINPALAQQLLQSYLGVAQRWLEPGDPLRQRLLQPGETPAAAAQRLSSATHVLDVQYRKTLLAGGLSGLQSATDPLIRFAMFADSAYHVLEGQWENITADETVQKERLGKALFAAYGTSLPPDATFTLRISDGEVERYPYNGTTAAPFTTFYGMFGRSAGFSDKEPWNLPASFEKARDQIALGTRLDFVSTNDITGGNSGSPVIDQEGRIVGLAFDGNVEQLPNEFLFSSTTARTIAVHSAGILEALRNIYHADRVLNELLSTTR